MSHYDITGPVNVGSTGEETNINGDVALTDVGTAAEGDIFYRGAGTTFYLEALPIGGSGEILTSDGTVPTWGPAPASAITGFLARYTGSQIVGSATAVDLFTWSVASAPEYDTLVGDTFNVANGRFTSLNGGKYIVVSNVQYINSATAAGTRTFELRINSVSVVVSKTYQSTPDVSIPVSIGLSTQLSLTAGQYITLAVYSSNALYTQTIDTNGTWFGVSKFS